MATRNLKRANGNGSIVKLSGKHRKPYACRVTIRAETIVNPKNPLESTVIMKRKYIGYGETYDDAVRILADYFAKPIDLDYKDVLFKELFVMWYKTKEGSVSKSWINAVNASFNAMEELHNRKINDLRTHDFEMLFEYTDKMYPTMKKMLILLHQMFEYADSHDMIYKNYTKYISLAKYTGKNPNSIKRDIFKRTDIKRIWKYSDDLYNSIVIILIYTGLRISELFDLKREDVHLEERYLDIKASKTEAGIRLVPIADVIMPLVKRWYDEGNEYLVFNPSGNQFKYRNYRDSYWNVLMAELGLEEHRPHDTRHTFVSLYQSVENSDERILKKIVGHRGTQDFTLKVYTQFEMERLLEEVNKIII